MLNEDDYPSSEDTSDEEYVPSDQEKVSEEENSGEEEDSEKDDTHEEKPSAKGKRKRPKSKQKPRKRTGGIKLDDDSSSACVKETTGETDNYNKQLAEDMKADEILRKEQEVKKKSDALWADFMKDVGDTKSKPKSTNSSAENEATKSTTISSPCANGVAAKSTTDTAAKSAANKVTVTKEFDFAGEIVQVTKQVSADSKEAKEAASVMSAKPSIGPSTSAKPAVIPGLTSASQFGLGRGAAGSSGFARGRGRGGGVGGLSSVLGKLGKKPKISVLEKSKLDWEKFKTDEGISEELQIHNRGKDGFIERKQFLERTDLRQFEIEKDLRQRTKFS